MHMAATTSGGASSGRQAQDSLDPQMSNQQQRASNASPKGTGSRKEGYRIP